MAVTVLDAGILIALLDASDAHHTPARDAVAAAIEAGRRLVLPASAYAEVLVEPIRRRGDAVDVVDRMIDALPIEIQALDRSIARHAAALRATHGARLRLPDALIVATAMALKGSEVLTADHRWPDMLIPISLV
jgi:predicted nucleic acid-binding protein